MVIEILLDNVAYSVDDGYSISLLAGSVGSADLIAKVPAGGIVPRTFMSCQVLADGDPIFWGIINNVSSPVWSSGFESAKYSISAQSGECIFNNRLVSDSWTSKYTHEIIQDLFDNYIAAEGLTLGHIDTSAQLYTQYNCAYTQLAQVLSALADDIGYTYYVSPDKKFYFISRTSFVQMAAPAHITGVKLEEENGEIRTRQIVTGATEETGTQTSGCYWTTGQTSFPLGYEIASVNGVTINGVSRGVGLIGVDEDNVNVTFLYQKGGTQLVLNPNATVQPAAGQNVVAVFVGYYDIVVENENAAMIAEIKDLNGTSGLIEQVLTDTTITSYADADAKSLALLKQYSDRDQSITCDARSLGDTALYNMWTFALTDQKITGQFVVVERNIKSFGVDSVLVSVKLKNKGYFSRYGTTLISKPKTAGTDSKVYKSISLTETLSTSDSISIVSAGVVFWATSGDFTDPMLDGFYPV